MTAGPPSAPGGGAEAAAAVSSSADRPEPTSLSSRLREGTRHLHTQAERAGLMPALLRGELPLPRYVRLLQELLALYRALESALVQPGAPAFDPALFRAEALQQDIETLVPRCPAMPPASPSPDAAPSDLSVSGEAPARTVVMRDYVRHLQALSPPLLAAHAYVRYLGDLAGGQVLRRIVARSYGLQDEGVRFYAFGPAVPGLVAGLRQVLDALPSDVHGPIVEEACAAFRRHVDLFEALQAAQAPPA